MGANVMVLTDESLGGVKREYTEVKRKEAVGERIKVISGSRYPVGKVGECTRNDEFDDGSIDTTLSFPGSEHDGFIDTAVGNYVVLTPTDIVVIGDVRYRLVERKANEGERILIVAADDTYDMYENGDIFTVDRDNGWHDLGIEVDAVSTKGDGNDGGYIANAEYRVLEPVKALEFVADTLPARVSGNERQIEGLTDAVAKLTLKVAENERRIAELVEAARPKAYTGIDRVPTHGERLEISRDAIIERAKRDVAELITMGGDYNGRLPKQSPVWNDFYTVEYVVNREKRTVVALVRPKYGDGFIHRGIARCAPDECFNVHIGKVIALRRALGLEVPVEYVKAPKPTEARVGDIVSWRYGAESCHSYEVRKVDGVNYDLLSLDSGDLYENHSYTADIIVPKIIDDSREGTEVNV